MTDFKDVYIYIYIYIYISCLSCYHHVLREKDSTLKREISPPSYMCPSQSLTGSRKYFLSSQISTPGFTKRMKCTS